MVVSLGVYWKSPTRRPGPILGPRWSVFRPAMPLKAPTTVCTERGNVSVSIGVLENASS